MAQHFTLFTATVLLVLLAGIWFPSGAVEAFLGIGESGPTVGPVFKVPQKIEGVAVAVSKFATTAWAPFNKSLQLWREEIETLQAFFTDSVQLWSRCIGKGILDKIICAIENIVQCVTQDIPNLLRDLINNKAQIIAEIAGSPVIIAAAFGQLVNDIKGLPALLADGKLAELVGGN